MLLIYEGILTITQVVATQLWARECAWALFIHIGRKSDQRQT